MPMLLIIIILAVTQLIFLDGIAAGIQFVFLAAVVVLHPEIGEQEERGPGRQVSGGPAPRLP